MAASGVDTVVSSWWGRGAYEDWMLADLVSAVRAAGLRLAIHLEPYKGRSLTTVAADLAYFRASGSPTSTCTRPTRWGAAADWAPAVATQPDMRFFAESGNLTSMLSTARSPTTPATAGFDGIYTYDVVRYGAAEMAAACGAARQRRLLCSPSVGPGFDGRRAGMVKIPVVDPAAGLRYDTMWRAAMAAGADVVSITSWNEWHEGTQIEPAKPYCFPRRLLLPRLRRRLRPLRPRRRDGLHGPHGRVGPRIPLASRHPLTSGQADVRSACVSGSKSAGDRPRPAARGSRSGRSALRTVS